MSRSLNWFDNVEFRPHPWPGLTWMTSMRYVEDVQRAKEFYESVFGIVPIFEFCDENNRLVFARMRYRGANFVLSDKNFYSAGINQSIEARSAFATYVYVDDAIAAFNKAIQAGAISIQEPKIEFWGDRVARIKDPFGYLFDIATKVEDKK